LEDGLLDIAVYPDFNKAELLSYFAKKTNEGSAPPGSTLPGAPVAGPQFPISGLLYFLHGSRFPPATINLMLDDTDNVLHLWQH
jgi:hypothetical protein